MENRKKYLSFGDQLPEIKRAPYVYKKDWICEQVEGKTVLDLGIVDHDISQSLAKPNLWLHGIIKQKAKSLTGVDILEEDVARLAELGYDVIAANAETVQLDRKFDVVVCGDLIEHLANPLALLNTIAHHLKDDGIGVVSTPNPFAVTRFFNLFVDGWTGINSQHVMWLCPQTMYQLVERSPLYIDRWVWLETDYPNNTIHQRWGAICNFLAAKMSNRNHYFHTDFGVILKKR